MGSKDTEFLIPRRRQAIIKTDLMKRLRNLVDLGK